MQQQQQQQARDVYAFAQPIAGPAVNIAELGASFSGLLGLTGAGAGAGAGDRAISEQEMAQGASERRNLLLVFQLAIKNLLEACVDLGEPVTDDSRELNDFCLILENVFRQGLRAKRSMFARDRNYWEFVAEGLERHPVGSNIITTVRSLSGIRTAAGRGRAFIRSALMEQRLSDYWTLLLDNRDLVNAYYEPYALLRSDDVVPVSGLLVGLATIEFNLYLRGDELERMSDTIDWGRYLRNGNLGSGNPAVGAQPAQQDRASPRASLDSVSAAAAGDEQQQQQAASEQLQRRLALATEQKNYTEELKRKAEAKLQETQERLEQALAAQRTLEEQLAARVERVAALERALLAVQTELQQTRANYRRDVDLLNLALDGERQALRAAQGDAAQLNEGIRHTLANESKLRLAVEQELAQERQRRAADRDQAAQQIAALEAEVKRLDDERAALSASITAQQEHVAQSARERDAALDEVAGLKEALGEVREELKETKIKLALAVKAKKEAKALKAELDLAQERNADLQKTLDEARRTTIAVMGEKNEKDRQLLGAVDRLDQANALLDQRRAEYDAEQAKSAELAKTVASLQQQIEALQEDLQERDKAFWELGQKFQSSQIKVADLTESQKTEHREWVDDRKVSHCKQCNDKFSVNRRKHHCRSCGDIFCATCSNNRTSLPAYPKPVRVCDQCYHAQLQKHSS